VVDLLNLEEMPPEDEPQLEEAERIAMIQEMTDISGTRSSSGRWLLMELLRPRHRPTDEP